MTYKPVLFRAAAALLIASVALGGLCEANARTLRRDDSFVPEHTAGTPLLAVVGLQEQRVSIYDAKGKILESPVSTGQTGYETPAGIYSIVQKEEEHHSNLYDDASMPFMERITWTGMALHAGVLPGYPASHGCVRLPHDFAARLYDVTNLGMRVVVVREDIAPAEVAQPFMFNNSDSKPKTPRVTATTYGYSSRSDSVFSQLRTELAEKSAAAQNAARRVRDAKVAASKKAAEAATAAQAVHAAEGNLAKAQSDLKVAEQAVEKASPEGTARATEAQAQALSRVNQAQAQLESAKAQAQAKSDAAAQAQAEGKAAEVAFASAMDAAEEAKLNLAPVSVLISRKNQRLYIRKGNLPVFEAPVMIRDAGKPIGTFVFTALDYNGTDGGMRWNMVSMYKDAVNIEPYSKPKQGGPKVQSSGSAPAPADVAGAEAALNRLTLTQESIDRISEVVLPGSSLIISDEGPSIETGKDTDFVIFMPGEPQGGIAIRAHHHEARRGGGGWFGDDWFGWSSYPSSRGGGQYRSRGGGWGGGGGPFGFPF